MKNLINFLIFTDWNIDTTTKYMITRQMNYINNYSPIDYIISTGNNIIVDSVNDTKWEDRWINYFHDMNSTFLIGLGEEDMKYDYKTLINYSKINDKWVIPDLYYSKELKKCNKNICVTVTTIFINTIILAPTYKNDIILNQELPTAEDHYNWLINILDQSNSDYIIVIGNYELNIKELELLRTYLKKYNVDMYICAGKFLGYYNTVFPNIITNSVTQNNENINEINDQYQFLSHQNGFAELNIHKFYAYINWYNEDGNMLYSTSINSNSNIRYENKHIKEQFIVLCLILFNSFMFYKLYIFIKENYGESIKIWYTDISDSNKNNEKISLKNFKSSNINKSSKMLRI